MSNIDALSDFVEHNGVKRDPFGRCRFDADVTIRAGGRGGAETLPARVSFASGDTDQLYIENGSVLKAGEVPLSYRTDFGDWRHKDGRLLVSGRYKSFDYETEVMVAV